MGIDARCSLPPNVRVQDVAKVLGILLGLPCSLEPLGPKHGVVCLVPGANVRGHAEIPEMAKIDLRRPNGDPLASFFYHYEVESQPGRRHVVCGSVAIRIAAFRRLAEFFGGSVDYQDCDDEDADDVYPDKSDAENMPSDGEPWDIFQRRIAAIQPLMRVEILRCEKYAAYGLGDP